MVAVLDSLYRNVEAVGAPSTIDADRFRTSF